MNHLTSTQIQAFKAQQLAPTELLEVDDHLTACAECKASLESEALSAASVAALRAEFRKAEPHVSNREIRQFAAGEMVSTVATLHIAHCKLCSAEVADLKRFIQEQPVMPPVPVKSERQVSWFRSLNPAWTTLTVATVLLIAAGLIYLRLHSVVSNTNASNAAAPTVSTPAVSTPQQNSGTSVTVSHSAPVKVSSAALADLLLPIYPVHKLRGEAEDEQFAKGMTAYQSGDCFAAVAELVTVKVSSAESRAAHLYTGACQLHLGKYDAAQASLHVVTDGGDSLELEPALYELAQVALAENNPTLAHSYLSQTIALRGDYETRARTQESRLQTLTPHQP
jgi:predicted anti-sigma-YlaC factor YlaD